RICSTLQQPPPAPKPQPTPTPPRSGHYAPARCPDPTSSNPRRRDQRIPASRLARPEKHLITDPASSFGTAQAFLAALERATEATPSKDPRHAYPDEVIAAAVTAAAPVIVAAELRRLSSEFVVF